jgi:uncharacterized protein YjbI with pentapeptide repeats
MLRFAMAAFAWVFSSAEMQADDPHRFGESMGMDMRRKMSVGGEMSMTDLGGAYLQGADMTGVSLRRTNLRGANLSRTRNWSAAKLISSVDAREADFRHADLRGASVEGGKFEEADFREADLRGAWLSGRFHGAQFDGAQVDGTVLLGALGLDDSQIANLAERGALVEPQDFVASLRAGTSAAGRYAHGFRLDHTTLNGLSFVGTNLHSASLSSASLLNADLSDSNLCWASMHGARLNGAVLLNAQLVGANLWSANLVRVTARGANLSWTSMHGVRLDGAVLNHSLFVGADLKSASLVGVAARGASFSNAKLSQADLTNAELQGADFSHADLRGANLEGARLEGANWKAAILDGVQGLDPVVEKELRRQAARWKYELAQSLRRTSAWPAWSIGMLGGIAAMVRLWRRPGQRGFARALAAFQVVALTPLGLLLLYVITASSPAAQRSSDLGVLSWLVGAFDPVAGMMVLAGLIFLVVVPVLIIRGRRRPGQPLPLVLAAAAFTGMALLTALPCLISLAPKG